MSPQFASPRSRPCPRPCPRPGLIGIIPVRPGPSPRYSPPYPADPACPASDSCEEAQGSALPFSHQRPVLRRSLSYSGLSAAESPTSRPLQAPPSCPLPGPLPTRRGPLPPSPPLPAYPASRTPCSCAAARWTASPWRKGTRAAVPSIFHRFDGEGRRRCCCLRPPTSKSPAASSASAWTSGILRGDADLWPRCARAARTPEEATRRSTRRRSAACSPAACRISPSIPRRTKPTWD
mmetsp:Transcript_831/g.1286  ORF Transcript_831/g.1286 Transcript_831/m.1286 type:complete len:236 (+) Transcript_831:602-1309(+)